MQLPFTVEQFFDVIRAYNMAVWPAQVVLLVLAVAAIVLVVFPRRWSGAGHLTHSCHSLGLARFGLSPCLLHVHQSVGLRIRRRIGRGRRGLLLAGRCSAAARVQVGRRSVDC